MFSIIIPHKNTPDLLHRLLKSIPEIDIIEVIIIDDNSDDLDKENFPGINRENTEIIFSNKSLTAGGARNLGVKKAQGKWIIFADSDDFFHENFHEFLLKNKNSSADLIYFAMDSVFSDTLLPSDRASDVVEVLNKAHEGDKNSRDTIRYKFLYPSCKLIKKSIIDQNNIQFDEVPASNDTMFGIKVAVASKKIIYTPEVLYCLTYRKNSLVTSYKYENLKSRLVVSIKLYDFLKNIGKEKYAQSSFSHWMQIRYVSYFLFFKDFFFLINKRGFLYFFKELSIKFKL